ncbi:hypothetical protein B0A52_03621 [Exophiala mesophila]|uniref:Uncharacterized protein n=1 Tax=Exophiala mesophila TaxID=212818 RepID=A0A438N9X8_EXOME|nr:hypothetical protein B0A52_03621 [Exophiala mesophila]
MGKAKGKAPKSSSRDTGNKTTQSRSSVGDNRPAIKASDGVNVEGWTEADIRTYNDLLEERAKLEKEKDELERKSSRHHTYRALLDESTAALDSSFRLQLTGEYIFTGSSRCCLDQTSSFTHAPRTKNFHCAHEICKRAKTHGISWAEFDTIKYYHARILTEKSQRIREALGKQRDVELVRMKKDEDDELAQKSRKNPSVPHASLHTINTSKNIQSMSSSILDTFDPRNLLLNPRNAIMLDIAKENEDIVSRIREELEKIRGDVNTGRISAGDARVKLDQANLRMAEAEKQNKVFRQTLLNDEAALSRASQMGPSSLPNILPQALASGSSDAFSHALSVMKGFFSTSNPQDIQTAIADLRKVLQMTGPMSPVLGKSFQALEEMLSKTSPDGLKVDATTTDGKRQMIDFLMNMRGVMGLSGADATDTSLGPGLDQTTLKANEECIKIENAAMKEMSALADRMFEADDEKVAAALEPLKEAALLKSPIPPLSRIVLEDKIIKILFGRSIFALIRDARTGVGQTELQAKITSLVMRFAERKPDKFIDVLTLVSETIAINRNSSPALLEALKAVDISMTRFVAKTQAERVIQPPSGNTSIAADDRREDLLESNMGFHSCNHGMDLVRSTTVTKGHFKKFQKLFEDGRIYSDLALLRSTVARYYKAHLGNGLWEIFKVFVSHKGAPDRTHIEPGFWRDEIDFYRENISDCQLADQQFADTIVNFARAGVCPAQVSVVISQHLTYQTRANFSAAVLNVRCLAMAIGKHMTQDLGEWFLTWSFIAALMTDFYMHLVCELTKYKSEMGIYQEAVPVVAADVLSLVCALVIGVPDQARQIANLRAIGTFIGSCILDYKKLQDPQAYNALWDRLTFFVNDKKYICGPGHSCRSKVREVIAKHRSSTKASAVEDTTGRGSANTSASREQASSDDHIKPSPGGRSSSISLGLDDDERLAEKHSRFSEHLLEHAVSDEVAAHSTSNAAIVNKPHQNLRQTYSGTNEMSNGNASPQPSISHSVLSSSSKAKSSPPATKVLTSHRDDTLKKPDGFGTMNGKVPHAEQASPSISTALSSEAPLPHADKFQPRELDIQRKLSKWMDNLLELKESMTEVCQSRPVFAESLQVVINRLRETAQIHHEVAYSVARGQGYIGLQEWLERSCPWSLGRGYFDSRRSELHQSLIGAPSPAPRQKSPAAGTNKKKKAGKSRAVNET